MAFPIRVFPGRQWRQWTGVIGRATGVNTVYSSLFYTFAPVPGGPNNNRPLGNVRRPLNRSGLVIGQQIISVTHFFANSNPAISLNSTTAPFCMMSISILLTRAGSNRSSSGGSLRSRVPSLLLLTPVFADFPFPNVD